MTPPNEKSLEAPRCRWYQPPAPKIHSVVRSVPGFGWLVRPNRPSMWKIPASYTNSPTGNARVVSATVAPTPTPAPPPREIDPPDDVEDAAGGGGAGGGVSCACAVAASPRTTTASNDMNSFLVRFIRHLAVLWISMY